MITPNAILENLDACFEILERRIRITERLEPEANLSEANLTWISSIIFIYFQFTSGFRLFVTGVVVGVGEIKNWRCIL